MIRDFTILWLFTV